MKMNYTHHELKLETKINALFVRSCDLVKLGTGKRAVLLLLAFNNQFIRNPCCISTPVKGSQSFQSMLVYFPSTVNVATKTQMSIL